MMGDEQENPMPTTDAVGGLGWLERLFSVARLSKADNRVRQAARGKPRLMRDRKDNRQVRPAQGWQKLVAGRGAETRQERRADAFALETYEVSRDLPAEPRKARRRIARMRLKLRAAEGRTAEVRR
jgi:hypothetical protein